MCISIVPTAQSSVLGAYLCDRTRDRKPLTHRGPWEEQPRSISVRPLAQNDTSNNEYRCKHDENYRCEMLTIGLSKTAHYRMCVWELTLSAGRGL
jgi:hypothetical protein